MSFFEIVTYSGYLLLLVNIIVYFNSPFFKKAPFKIFAFYLLAMGIIQIISQSYYILNVNNLFLSHYYFIVQFLLLSLFYTKLIPSLKLIKILTLVVILCIAIKFFLDPKMYFKFSLFEIIICSIPLLSYSFIFFAKHIDGKNENFIYINSGVFIYILSSTLIFSSGNLMPKMSPSVNKIIWLVNVIIYFIYQFLIFLEWFRNFRTEKYDTLHKKYDEFNIEKRN